jgi:hypothetical protein
MGSDQEATQLLKVTVVVIFYFGYTPSVLSADNVSTVSSFDGIDGANNSKWHRGHDVLVTCSSGFLFTFNGAGINVDILSLNNFTDLSLNKENCQFRSKQVEFLFRAEHVLSS